MNFLENVDIKDYCTLKVGGQFRYFTEVQSVDDIKEAYNFAESKDLKVFVVGGGSNIVFPDGILDVLAIKVNILGFEVLKEDDVFTEIKVGAGENWDNFVERTVEMGFSGVEALSLIPGTVGGTPVQNVGAYGQEVKNVITSVEVFDKDKKTKSLILNKDCLFSYRNSLFKKDPPQGAKGRYIITYVNFKLSKSSPKLPDYPGVKKYFEEKNILSPNLKQIREAIIYIRSNKLPDPKNIPNVGSFFKNPIIEKEIAENLKKEYDSMPLFCLPDQSDLVKVPAGWLIENVGLKGKIFGNISTYKNNALVLINNGDATFSDIVKTRDEIIKNVKEKFGITLETEPEFVG